jgi:hypothetical protein
VYSLYPAVYRKDIRNIIKHLSGANEQVGSDGFVTGKRVFLSFDLPSQIPVFDKRNMAVVTRLHSENAQEYGPYSK